MINYENASGPAMFWECFAEFQQFPENVAGFFKLSTKAMLKIPYFNIFRQTSRNLNPS